MEMKPRDELSGRFDELMARMRPVEPSEHFDFEFRRRLEAVRAEAAEETAFERLARGALEGARRILVPARPVLVRVAVFSAVIYAVLIRLGG